MLQPKDRALYNEALKKERQPRFEVVADFPNNKDFPVGVIITLHRWRCSTYWAYTIKDCQGDREYLQEFFDTYPHIFKRLT